MKISKQKTSGHLCPHLTPFCPVRHFQTAVKANYLPIVEKLGQGQTSSFKIFTSPAPPTPPTSQFISWNRATVIEHTTQRNETLDSAVQISFSDHNYRWQESKGHRTGTKQTYSHNLRSEGGRGGGREGPTSCSSILIFSHMINM